MSGQVCGCVQQPCGCCEGVQQLTPADECNRPGLGAISYRVGTHGQFLATMKARVSTMVVDGVGSDGQTIGNFRPLQGLTTRDPNDFSIALCDGWATVGDVLSFYQERIANEGYLRTATERRSVLELSNLVGYTLRPGVAASVYLAYTLDGKQIDPVTIQAGARSQSIPGPGESPQSFETSEDLLARPEWNNLQVRLTQPQNLTLDNVLKENTIYVAGVATNLKAGDKLLLVYKDDGSVSVMRTVVSVDTQFPDQRTAITLQAVNSFTVGCVPLLMACISSFPAGTPQKTTPGGSAQIEAEAILNDTLLGAAAEPSTWVDRIKLATDNVQLPPAYQQPIGVLQQAIIDLAKTGGTSVFATTDPEQFANALLVDPIPQARNSLSLRRSLVETFVPQGAAAVEPKRRLAVNSEQSAVMPARAYADAGTQLLLNLAPRLQDSYYAAWRGANLNSAQAPLLGLYAFRVSAAMFGSGASKLPAYAVAGNTSSLPPGTLLPQDQWHEWKYQDGELGANAFLDQSNDAVVPGSYVALVNSNPSYLTHQYKVLKVTDATSLPRTAYGLSGKTTALVFSSDWRITTTASGGMTTIDDLRTTQVYAQSQPLTLIDAPITDPAGKTVDVSGQEITLDGLYNELKSGRWAIFSGERADVDQVEGVNVSELQMVSGLHHGYDPQLPGDQIHTTLILATKLAYTYKRGSLTIYGNVVKATHGETRNEMLGNGDGSKELQSFTLKQPPLTFVAAPTAVGADSTLHAYVNDVEWRETNSLAWLSRKDRGFATSTDDAGNTTLSFGNGEHGARLPSGVLNVKAIYRNGIGRAGNVRAEQISLLQTRPLGVNAVINPLRASGGADKESRDLARENAPLSVMPLDRLVSVRDYADFTRRFAGIAKAIAQKTSDGRRELVYLTIAGVDDAPIDASSDLYRNLLDALRLQGDPDLPLLVKMRELKMLVLSANIRILPDFLWEKVVGAVRSQLLATFGFDQRALGQPVRVSEVITCIQNVRGVAYVDVDAFGSVSEQTTAPDGNRHLTTQDDIQDQVSTVVGSTTLANVITWCGGSDKHAKNLLRPAELAIFAPAVPATINLNQTP